MASNIHVQHSADGTRETLRRVKRQGAPVKGDELKLSIAIPVRMTKHEYEMFCIANNGFMSNSGFASLMIFTGIRQLFDSNNC